MVKVWFSEDNDMKVSLSEMGGSKLSGVVKPEPVWARWCNRDINMTVVKRLEVEGATAKSMTEYKGARVKEWRQFTMAKLADIFS